jgi:hypothetical protein
MDWFGVAGMLYVLTVNVFPGSRHWFSEGWARVRRLIRERTWK